MKRLYRFAWSQNFGYQLQIPKDAVVEGVTFGKLRAALVKWNDKFYITDRYALRRV